MNYNRVTTILCILFLSAVLIAVSSSASDKNSTIYVEETSSKLAQEVSEIVNEISRRFPTAPREEKNSVKTILSYDLVIVSENAEVRDYVKKAGNKIIPVIARLLSDKNEETRRKALAALGYLRKPKEQFDDSYKDTEKAILILTERSSHDKSQKIRLHALSIMAGLAMERIRCRETIASSKILSRAIKTLQAAAASDPDELVRREVRTALEHLGYSPSPKPVNQ